MSGGIFIGIGIILGVGWFSDYLEVSRNHRQMALQSTPIYTVAKMKVKVAKLGKNFPKCK
jgi:hypothetical protein